VLDGLPPHIVMVGTPEQRGVRYVQLVRSRHGGADMRKAKDMSANGLVDAVRRRVEREP